MLIPTGRTNEDITRLMYGNENFIEPSGIFLPASYVWDIQLHDWAECVHLLRSV